MDKEIKERIAAINSGIIPEGYKKTKVGIVPVEWELSKMKKICEINRGGSPRPIEDYITDDNNGINWIKIGDTSVGGKYISSTKEKIKPEGARKSRQVFEGDFLLSNSMSYGRPYILKTSGCIHDGWLVISNYSDYFDLEFFYYLLCHHNIQRQYDMLSAGSGVQNLNKDLVAQVNVIIPPLPEQQKIAEILSTQDKLIELQEKKIEQLKELKKAYLQKMFPKKGSKYPELRFKGFTDPWEQRKLGELADIVGGGTPSTSNSEYWDGDIDWYAPAEIANQIFVSSSERKITQQGYDNSSAKMLPVGTVLFTSRAGIGKTAILRKEGCTNQGFQSIVPHENMLDSYFIFSRTEELKRYGEIKGAGSTFVEVSGKQMASMELMMPKTIEEQKKIGAYFSLLDSLITLHQRKSEQEKQKKKALMQLLLTGIVRTK